MIVSAPWFKLKNIFLCLSPFLFRKAFKHLSKHILKCSLERGCLFPRLVHAGLTANREEDVLVATGTMTSPNSWLGFVRRWDVYSSQVLILCGSIFGKQWEKTSFRVKEVGWIAVPRFRACFCTDLIHNP